MDKSDPAGSFRGYGVRIVSVRNALREGRQFRAALGAMRQAIPKGDQRDVLDKWWLARAVTGCSAAQYLTELDWQAAHLMAHRYEQAMDIFEAARNELIVRGAGEPGMSQNDRDWMAAYSRSASHVLPPGVRAASSVPAGTLFGGSMTARADGGTIVFNRFGGAVLMEAHGYGRNPSPATLWAAKHALSREQARQGVTLWFPGHLDSDAKPWAAPARRTWSTCGHRRCSWGTA